MTATLLTPAMVELIELQAAAAREDRANRWRNYEKFKAWCFFKTDCQDEADEAMRLYVELVKL